MVIVLIFLKWISFFPEALVEVVITEAHVNQRLSHARDNISKEEVAKSYFAKGRNADVENGLGQFPSCIFEEATVTRLQTNNQKYYNEDETQPVILRRFIVLNNQNYVPREKGEPNQSKDESTLVKLVVRNLSSVIQLENV